MLRNYIYKGLLKGVKGIPSSEELQKCLSIEFSAEELKKWSSVDHASEGEWRQGRVEKRLIEDPNEGFKYLVFQGDFTNVGRVDLLSDRSLQPSFWVPLSTISKDVPHFPISSHNYPVVEITYRVQAGRGIPAWSWYYNTGQFFEFLESSQDWVTVARAWSYNGFPRRIENFVVRLYSRYCTKESMYIRSVRFREYTEAEREFLESKVTGIISENKPIRYSFLDDFFPLGTYVKAATVKRMSNHLGIDVETYLDLLFEDIAQHYHNMVFFEDFYEFLPGDKDIVFDLANKYGIKVVVALEEEGKRLGGPRSGDYWREKEQEIKRNASNPALLGWVIKEGPLDEEIDEYLAIKRRIEQLDSNHPVIYLTREANSFQLYASVSSVSGLSHWKSKDPWELGQIVRSHYRLLKGQQLWVIPPVFVFGSGFPPWNSAPEIRLMINLAISSGARGWLSYTYHNVPLWAGGECERSMTGPFLCSSDVWQELGARLGRFFALAPLFLKSVPVNKPAEFDVEVRSRRHPRSRCPGSVEILLQSWFKGENFWIFYLVNQDTSEVTGVDVKFRKEFGRGYRVYDATQFVREHKWLEVGSEFHREMFPGQGLILLIASEDVCKEWEEKIIKGLVESVSRQIRMDMELWRYYCKDFLSVYDDKVNECNLMGNTVEKLRCITQIREEVFNRIYGCESLVKSRGKLFEIESLLCACDEELNRFVGLGKEELVGSYRDKLLLFAKEAIKWRLAIKRGEGGSVLSNLEKTCESLHKMLAQLRASSL